MRRKLSLLTEETHDVDLIQSPLDWMQQSKVDFTNTFRRLSSEKGPVGERYSAPNFRAWYSRWRNRLQRESRAFEDICSQTRSVNPAVIPRNHRVEEVLSAAEDHNDLAVMH